MSCKQPLHSQDTYHVMVMPLSLKVPATVDNNLVSYCRGLSDPGPINKIYRLQMDIISLLYFAPLRFMCSTTNSAPNAPSSVLASLAPWPQKKYYLSGNTTSQNQDRIHDKTRWRKEIDSTGIIISGLIQKGIKRVLPDTTRDIHPADDAGVGD